MGSLAGIALCSWYHLRMLERKRLAKTYHVVPGDEDQDLELGEGVGAQENGVTAASRTLDEEVDNWDENMEDAWDEDENAGEVDNAEEGLKTPSASSAGEVDGDPKKRAD